MEVSVPIHLIGTPAGVVLGGVLDLQLREVTLLCMPDAIPDQLEFDVSHLELGDSLHISDLTVPKGAEFHTDGALTVATVLVPRGLKEGEGEVAAVEEETEADATDPKDAKDEKAGDDDAK